MNANSSKDLSFEELKLLGEAIDSSPSPLTLYDSNYNIIYANQTSRILWPELHTELAKGVGLRKAAYETSKIIFPGAPEEVIQQATEYVIHTFNSPEANEMKANNGRWIKLTHHQIADKAVAGIGVEITDLKKQEKELKHAKRAQENLIEVLEHGLLVVDDNGIITSFNPAYKKYCDSLGLKITKGMPVKKLTQDFLNVIEENTPESERDARIDEFYKTHFGNSDSWEDEFSLPDGRHILRHQNYRKLVGNIITTTDVTEIKSAQLKAESAERSKSEFLANMSHEIRTPMNGIMGMAQLLLLSELNDKEKNFVKVIERSGDALLTIINDILDFSKIEAGQITLEQESFNLRDSVEDVIALLSVVAAAKGIDILFQIKPDLPERYLGDAGRFRQIMTNIIGNAVKFTNDGHVHIDIKGQEIENHTEIEISIKDTGIGIPLSKIDDVFDKFKQADGTKTRKYEGTGLGLSIAKQLVNLMGGDIQVESEVGKGSCFKVNVNLQTEKQSLNTKDRRNDFEGKKVLIIDGNPISTKILREQFVHWRCKSAAVQTDVQGMKALKIAKKNEIKFDLIVLNCQILDETTENFVDEVKANSDFSNIPIIILTSLFENELERRMCDRETLCCVTKPYRLEALYETVETLFQRSTKTKKVASSLSAKASASTPSLQTLSKIECVPVTQFKDIRVPSVDVLVAEDNEVNSLYIGYVLEQLGVSFKIVENGKLAVEHFSTLNPRIILMDISMPILNGYEATQKIREIETQKNLTSTPIFAVTAHALGDDEGKCLNAGMDGYLTKPVPIKSIKDILLGQNIITDESYTNQAQSNEILARAV